MKEMDLMDLENISGGFRETNPGLPTNNMNIVCPKCHSTQAASFNSNALFDKGLGTVEYQCKCGCSFVVSNGQAILKKDFLSLCKDKGISYPFK